MYLLNFFKNATPIALIIVTIDDFQTINLFNEIIQLSSLEDVIKSFEFSVTALLLGLLQFPRHEHILVLELRPVDVNGQTEVSNL